jgi:hypothetical protein
MNLHPPIIPSTNWDQIEKKDLNQSMDKAIKGQKYLKHNGKIKYTWIPKNTKIDHPYQTPSFKETMGKNQKGKCIHQRCPQKNKAYLVT